MGQNPLPCVPPPRRSELDVFRGSITPERIDYTERLWFCVLPVLLTFALAGLVSYVLWSL